MRIDHLLPTESLAKRVVAIEIDREARKGKPIPSDHAPLVLDLDEPGVPFDPGWADAEARIAARGGIRDRAEHPASASIRTPIPGVLSFGGRCHRRRARMEAIGRPGSTIGRLGRRTTVLLAIVVLVAACSTPGGNTTNPPATRAPVTTAAPSMAPSAPGSAGLTLELADDAALGAYVTGEDGMALYVFLPDEGDSSACNGECAINWPPLTAPDETGVAAGDGVTGSIGTITREDGTIQFTLGGAPLYYFINDEAAGDVNGQGLQDVWYLASAEGTPVGADDEPPAEPTACSGPACY